jgi:hypothetical protein
MPRGRLASLCALALVALAPGARAGAAEPAPLPAPPNDNLLSAQVIRSLPATLKGTTVSATTEPGEADSSCASGTGASVWYSVRPASAERIALELEASGALDATVDVYHAVRSSLEHVACQQTDAHGKASLSFKASKNGLYEIRVAARAGSQRAPFTLNVFLPTPAVTPPGLPLPSGGASGQVDRIQDSNAAYHFTLRSGVSYLINLANTTPHACVSGHLFAPGTSSFEGGSPLLNIHCGGFRLFTPGPGQGGRYVLEVTPRSTHAGVQRFRLEVAPATSAETAPGVALANYAHAHGRLDSRGIRVIRLYRLDVHSHSNLTLKLLAPSSARFSLQLRNQDGHVIECACFGEGSQTLVHRLAPGRYYAVVSTNGVTAGNYTLIRESRTITRTSVSFSSGKAVAGQGLSIDVSVAPSESGPVTVNVERFDPVFGWQFYRQLHGTVSGGRVSLPFTPPALGRWRANASFEGTRTASPSSVGFSYLLAS